VREAEKVVRAEACNVNGFLTRFGQLEGVSGRPCPETDTDLATVQIAPLRSNQRRGAFAFGPLLARLTARSGAAVLAR